MYLEMSKTDRKKYVKIIERHLKNYNSYKIAIINLKEQLELFYSKRLKASSAEKNKVELLENELTELELLVESIDRSLNELTDTDLKFVKLRYFRKWSIEKVAMNIGYSDKALFDIRNNIMDKLIIRLSYIIALEESL